MDEAELIEYNSFKRLELKEAVEDAERELEYAKKELADFEEDNEGLYV